MQFNYPRLNFNPIKEYQSAPLLVVVDKIDTSTAATENVKAYFRRDALEGAYYAHIELASWR